MSEPTIEQVHVDRPTGDNPPKKKKKKKVNFKELGKMLKGMLSLISDEAPSEVAKGSGLYIRRKLEPKSAQLIAAWANAVGLSRCWSFDLHVTILHSKESVKAQLLPETIKIDLASSSPKLIALGDKIALAFEDKALSARHQKLLDSGATSDYPTYIAHISLCDQEYKNYDGMETIIVPEALKPDFDLLPGSITLMGEEFMPAEDEDAPPAEGTEKSFRLTATIKGMREDKRLVYGWASVVEKDGSEVVDVEGDAITEETIIRAAHDFMLNARKAKEMHGGPQVGDVVESIVFTKDLQAALGIDLNCIGWLICMKVHDEEVWKQVKDGKLKAFSIGGRGFRETVTD